MGHMFFVRHGQTVWNVENKICGATDIGLTELGHRQAIETGRAFAAQGLHADEILYSPLSRARDTALHISEITGIPAREEPRLKEQNFGKWEGTARNGVEFHASKRVFAGRNGGGESMLQLCQRIYNLLDEVKEQSEEKTYILVAHNGIARAVESYFREMTNDEYASFGVQNGEILRYDFDADAEGERKEEHVIGGMKCRIDEVGTGGPVLIWGMYPFREGEVEHLRDSIRELLPDQNFVLASFRVEDWNRQFSPWAADPVAEGEPGFAGEGRETLDWIEKEFVFYLQERFPDRKRYILGYSLAALFALWSGYESRLFDGIGCCSGSLWYNGWEEYARTHSPAREMKVYLSLGGKEEKSPNPVMATIGDQTRLQEKRMKENPLVTDCILEMNSGGHFADSGKRLAKAVKWLLQE